MSSSISSNPKAAPHQITTRAASTSKNLVRQGSVSVIKTHVGDCCCLFFPQLALSWPFHRALSALAGPQAISQCFRAAPRKSRGHFSALSSALIGDYDIGRDKLLSERFGEGVATVVATARRLDKAIPRGGGGGL